MRPAERNTIGFLGFAATFMAWQTLKLSTTIAATHPALADWIIAYFGWGAFAGSFTGVFSVYLYYAAKAAPAFRRATAPIVELRRRPLVLFVAGLATMTIGWSLISTAALVLSGSEIPWPVAYFNGFFTGVIFFVAVGYSVFLSYPFLRIAVASNP